MVEREDVPSGDDQPQTDVESELEPVEYRLTAIGPPTQNVSYVATLDREEWSVVQIPGGDTILKYGSHKGETYANVLQNHPEYLEIVMGR